MPVEEEVVAEVQRAQPNWPPPQLAVDQRGRWLFAPPPGPCRAVAVDCCCCPSSCFTTSSSTTVALIDSFMERTIKQKGQVFCCHLRREDSSRWATYDFIQFVRFSGFSEIFPSQTKERLKARLNFFE